MGGPKSQQFQMACPDSGGETADKREPPPSPLGVVLIAAYSSEDSDHNHEHTQVPPTPPARLSEEALLQPSTHVCSDERAVPTAAAAKPSANVININAGESPAARATCTAAHRHDYPPTPGASSPYKSPTSPSADAAGVVNKEGGEVDRSAIKTADNELATPTADRSSNNNDSKNDDDDDGPGKVQQYLS